MLPFSKIKKVTYSIIKYGKPKLLILLELHPVCVSTPLFIYINTGFENVLDERWKDEITKAWQQAKLSDGLKMPVLPQMFLKLLQMFVLKPLFV